MIEEYEKVRIKATGIVGEVIDIYYPANGNRMCIVESEEKGVPGGCGDANSWKLFHCTEDEVEKVN